MTAEEGCLLVAYLALPSIMAGSSLGGYNRIILSCSLTNVCHCQKARINHQEGKWCPHHKSAKSNPSCNTILYLLDARSLIVAHGVILFIFSFKGPKVQLHTLNFWPISSCHVSLYIHANAYDSHKGHIRIWIYINPCPFTIGYILYQKKIDIGLKFLGYFRQIFCYEI